MSFLAPQPFVQPHQLVVGCITGCIGVEPRGERVVEMPVRCGRTDKQGLLVIDKLQADSLRVSADHPRWGVVHGEVEKDKELLLRLRRLLPLGHLLRL